MRITTDREHCRDIRSIIAITAGAVLPAGFAEYFTDLTGAADHSVSFTAPGLDINSSASVFTESGGKRRLTTQTTAGAAEILPYYNQSGINGTQHLPTMFNPKTQAWYVEGRAAIETHGANTCLFPCSIALTSSGVMVGTMASNTFVGLGLVGTGFTGGNNSFLSFAASSSGAMALQTTTIPWSATIESYGLSFDGAGTISAWVNGEVAWQTTTLTQIGQTGGYHANQWVFATDATATTMLCDYLYGAGPRV